MTGTPAVKAKELIKKYYIRQPEQIKVEEIANAEYLIVEDKDFEDKDGEGSICHTGDTGLISVSNRVLSAGQRNFIISHEIGHFILDNIRKRVCTKYEISLRKVKGIIEQDANEFAAELLMPEEIYRDCTGAITENIKPIKEAAEIFKVSVSAAAIRYSQIGKTPAGVIMSERGKVKWSSINNYFPFKYIPKDYKVNSLSSANDFYEGKETSNKPEIIDPEAWFAEDFGFKKYRESREKTQFWEENIYMPTYNGVLTILWMRQ